MCGKEVQEGESAVKLGFRLINEVIQALGRKTRGVGGGPRAAGHSTDRCPITMLMIAEAQVR